VSDYIENKVKMLVMSFLPHIKLQNILNAPRIFWVGSLSFSSDRPSLPYGRPN